MCLLSATRAATISLKILLMALMLQSINAENYPESSSSHSSTALRHDYINGMLNLKGRIITHTIESPYEYKDFENVLYNSLASEMANPTNAARNFDYASEVLKENSKQKESNYQSPATTRKFANYFYQKDRSDVEDPAYELRKLDFYAKGVKKSDDDDEVFNLKVLKDKNSPFRIPPSNRYTDVDDHEEYKHEDKHFKLFEPNSPLRKPPPNRFVGRLSNFKKHHYKPVYFRDKSKPESELFHEPVSKPLPKQQDLSDSESNQDEFSATEPSIDDFSAAEARIQTENTEKTPNKLYNFATNFGKSDNTLSERSRPCLCKENLGYAAKPGCYSPFAPSNSKASNPLVIFKSDMDQCEPIPKIETTTPAIKEAKPEVAKDCLDDETQFRENETECPKLVITTAKPTTPETKCPASPAAAITTTQMPTTAKPTKCPAVPQKDAQKETLPDMPLLFEFDTEEENESEMPLLDQIESGTEAPIEPPVLAPPPADELVIQAAPVALTARQTKVVVPPMAGVNKNVARDAQQSVIIFTLPIDGGAQEADESEVIQSNRLGAKAKREWLNRKKTSYNKARTRSVLSKLKSAVNRKSNDTFQDRYEYYSERLGALKERTKYLRTGGRYNAQKAHEELKYTFRANGKGNYKHKDNEDAEVENDPKMAKNMFLWKKMQEKNSSEIDDSVEAKKDEEEDVVKEEDPSKYENTTEVVDTPKRIHASRGKGKKNGKTKKKNESAKALQENELNSNEINAVLTEKNKKEDYARYVKDEKYGSLKDLLNSYKNLEETKTKGSVDSEIEQLANDAAKNQFQQSLNAWRRIQETETNLSGNVGTEAEAKKDNDENLSKDARDKKYKTLTNVLNTFERQDENRLNRKLKAEAEARALEAKDEKEKESKDAERTYERNLNALQNMENRNTKVKEKETDQKNEEKVEKSAGETKENKYKNLQDIIKNFKKSNIKKRNRTANNFFEGQQLKKRPAKIAMHRRYVRRKNENRNEWRRTHKRNENVAPETGEERSSYFGKETKRKRNSSAHERLQHDNFRRSAKSKTKVNENTLNNDQIHLRINAIQMLIDCKNKKRMAELRERRSDGRQKRARRKRKRNHNAANVGSKAAQTHSSGAIHFNILK